MVYTCSVIGSCKVIEVSFNMYKYDRYFLTMQQDVSRKIFVTIKDSVDFEFTP